MLPREAGLITGGEDSLRVNLMYLRDYEPGTNLTSEIEYPANWYFIGESDLTAIEHKDPLPPGFSLQQNYPNPFNPETTINYHLSIAGEVSLIVYDMHGRPVKELAMGTWHTAGFHTAQWGGVNDAGEQVSSGIYFYRLTVNGLRPPADGYSAARKMILLR